jgi:hypothetical protein
VPQVQISWACPDPRMGASPRSKVVRILLILYVAGCHYDKKRINWGCLFQTGHIHPQKQKPVTRSACEGLLQPIRKPHFESLRPGIGDNNQSAVRSQAESGTIHLRPISLAGQSGKQPSFRRQSFRRPLKIDIVRAHVGRYYPLLL